MIKKCKYRIILLKISLKLFITFKAIVGVSSAVAVFAIIGAGVCYHRLQKNAKATEDVEYPAYGVTGPGKEISPTSGGDRKLAQNAQMYHYQHQKQQMIAFDRYFVTYSLLLLYPLTRVMLS